MLGLGSAIEKLSQNMPWNFPWSEAIRKRAIRYLLQRYVGQFLLETLSLEQLTVDLTNGTGIIRNLALDIHALNEVAEQLNLPFKFIDGYIREILVNIPWRNLFGENCFVGISGLKLVLQPKQRDGDISLVDSMIDSMSTSMQIAQECLSQVTQNEDAKIYETPVDKIKESESSSIDAIEHFARAIDTILNKIKVKFTDSVIRLEYVPKLSQSGVALEIRLDNIDYFDEAGLDKDLINIEKNQLESASFTSKKFLIEGVKLYTSEFSTRLATIPVGESVCSEPLNNQSIDVDTTEDIFHDTYNESLINSQGNIQDKQESKNNFENLSRKLILIAKLCNRQEIKLRLRKNDTVSGPKVHFEANCGSLLIFLSPRQVHLLVELSEGIASPENVDSTEVLNKVNENNQKPMNRNDFKKVEHELMKHLTPPDHVPCHALNLQEGWSSPPDILSDDEFLPLNPGSANQAKNNAMTSSTLTDASDLENSFTSTASSHIHGSYNKKILGDDILTNFKIRLNSLCMVLLHEDILISSADTKEIITSSSINEMQKKSQDFFSSIEMGFSLDHCYEAYLHLKNKLDHSCTLSHLRFIGTSLVVDGSERCLANKWEIKASISVGWCEVLECLNESEKESPLILYNKLLTFKDMETNNSSMQFYEPIKPKILINFNQSQNIKASGRLRRMTTPKSEIKINLSECLSEVDISLVDRISTLLNKQDVIVRLDDISHKRYAQDHIDNQTLFKEIIDEASSKPEMQINLIVKSPCVSLKFYFPIPDLRPLSDMNRVPWWKRNVRKETLIIEADDFHLNGEFGTSLTNIYEILSNDVHVLFQEKQDLPPFSLLRASGTKGVEKGFNPVRIYIRNFPSKVEASLDEDSILDHENIMTKSMMGFLEEVDTKVPSVFNTRQVASQQQESMNELKIPADSNEMNRFINDTLKNVQFDIDICLSDVQFILPSKHIYEVVYNRLVSDLLLWVPSAPKKYNKPIASLSSVMEDLSIGTTLIPDNYYKSCSGHFRQFTSLKNENLYQDETENEYNSFYDQNYESACNDTQSHNGQTLLGLKVKIKNAIAAIHTPYRDNESKIHHGKHGNVTFVVEKGFIFIASGYKGDINNTKGCITFNNVRAYHKANNNNIGGPICLDLEAPISYRKLDVVLHPCDMLCRMGGGNAPFNETKDNVSLCFNMKFDPLKNEQTIDMAGGMFGLTFRHYMLPATESWLSQLGDMFSVIDYPVDGYLLPDVITELNFNFEFCSIDYRPLYLPLKSYFAIDSLAVSCNLTIKGKSSVLLIIVEDAGLFLSQNLTCKKVNLKDDYVCIIDLGVFELCMKLDNDTLSIPIQEVLFTNNVVNIRTCSDSFKAFLELLIYLANEGDLVQEPDDSNISKDKRGILELSQTEETICSPYKQSIINQHDIVENLMQEAMMESTLPDRNCLNKVCDESEIDVDVFFFPDENTKKKRKDMKSETIPGKLETDTETALKEALEDEFTERMFDDNKQSTDEEFCVLDDVPGTGIKSPSGKPKAKHIKFENVLIKDEHFDPTNSYFQESRFCTPKHFPKPHLKYNLKEISLVWYMYAGSDFEGTNPFVNCQNKNSKTMMNQKSKLSPCSSPNMSVGMHCRKGPSVSFANGDAKIISGKSSPLSMHGSPVLSPRPNTNTKWFAVGGANRCHDTLMEIQLSKIRFKYELYPEECSIESRHVLMVNDVEIRDRLASSKINKFLYQFSSECFPKQASSNMIQIKAVTKRNDPSINTPETNLNISLRPIRLNVDQDALMFLSHFAEDLINSEKDSDYGEEESPCSSLSQAPVMMVNYNQASTDEKVMENETQVEKDVSVNVQSPIYFRHVVFSPDVPIKIDYHGKRIDMNSQYGALAGLIIGLGQLDHSQITLKRVEFKAGVLGVNKLINSLVNEWVYDIKKNQLPSILGGVGPMHSFMKLFGGLKDFIWLPVEQYHKDGRVLRGFQRGTSAFTSSSAYAVLDLTGRFIGCIQSTAETMYDMVSSGPSVRNKSYKVWRGQPKDIREGLTAAFGLVQNGLGDTANTIMKVAAEEHSHKGVSGAVGGVLRQIPPSLVQPIIIASEATCTVIGGMTNQLVPDARKEAEEKWKF